MVRDIRILEQSLGKEGIFLEEAVKKAKEKLERFLGCQEDMSRGEVMTVGDLHMLSPGTGLTWNERSEVVGKTLTQDVGKDELIQKTFWHESERSKLVITDIDGVWTDGAMYYGEDGSEFKRLSRT